MKNYVLVAVAFSLAATLSACKDKDGANPFAAYTTEVVWNAPGGIIVHEDQFFAQGVDCAQGSFLSVQAKLHGGPAIDLYVLDEHQYNRYTAGTKGQRVGDGTFTCVYKLSCPGLSQGFSSGWVGVPPGRYYVVIDNTDLGHTEPPFDGIDSLSAITILVEKKYPR